jgi:hypothetical protein
MNKTPIAIALAAVMALQGCAGTLVNGEQPVANNAGKIILGMIVVGGLVYAASRNSGGSDEKWVTSCGGNTCTTKVYR